MPVRAILSFFLIRGILIKDRRVAHLPLPERPEKVLLVDAQGEKQGVVDTSQALENAHRAKMDLVMVSSGVTPVCKILDYNKWLFEQKRKKQPGKNKSKTVLKEIKFRPVIDEGDFKVKLKRIEKFIAEGCRVKIVVRFRGREMMHQDIGDKLVERLLKSLAGTVNVEQMPKLDGKQIVFVLVASKR